MAKYKNDNAEVDAIQWTGEQVSEATDWGTKAINQVLCGTPGSMVRINNPEGNRVYVYNEDGEEIAYPGDYIVRYEHGRLAVFKKDDFELMYKITPSKELDVDRLAKDIYTAYCKAVGGVAFNGDPLPSAGDFFADKSKEKQVNAWKEAASVPYDKLFLTTQYLGHPSYGHSTVITEGIDNLRTEMFDYLGVKDK